MQGKKDIGVTVLSVAGFDPSAGAGVLADVKTFEANGVYGFGVASALTVQNDREFDSVEWVDTPLILRQIDALLRRFKIQFVKIGLIKDAETLNAVVSFLHERIDEPKIVFDPILSASAGFVFHDGLPMQILEGLCLLTPNLPEAVVLFGENRLEEKLSKCSHRVAVFLKGGHKDHDTVTDVLYDHGETFLFSAQRLPSGAKHGSGCVLSAALTAQLAQGLTLAQAAESAFRYTGKFLASSDGLLGFHSKHEEYDKS